MGARMTGWFSNRARNAGVDTAAAGLAHRVARVHASMRPPVMILEILQRHAEEVAFLWRLRDAAAVAPHHDRTSLAALDERLDAHLDGLRIAGDQGVEV